MAISLLVEIIGDASKLASELDGAKEKTSSFGDSAVGSALKVAAVGAAAVGVAVAIADMTAAAAEDRAEQEKLIRTYENVGISMAEATAATDAAIASGAEKAFSDSEVRAGLEGLITATGNADEANALLAQSMDIARQAGIPLEQAADAVAKAHAGQDAALRKLFPGMEKQKTAADTLTEATKLSSGAADEYSKSAEGMQKKGGDAFAELSEKIGSVFLPVMDELMPAIGPVLDAFGELLDAILPVLIPLVKLLAGAIKILADILVTAVGWLSKLIGWLNDAIGAIGRFLDSINPLKDFQLPSLPFLSQQSAAATALMGPSTRAGVGPGTAPATTVNVNVMSADPEQVVRAIRRWARVNGGSGPFTRGLDRSTA